MWMCKSIYIYIDTIYLYIFAFIGRWNRKNDALNESSVYCFIDLSSPARGGKRNGANRPTSCPTSNNLSKTIQYFQPINNSRKIICENQHLNNLCQ